MLAFRGTITTTGSSEAIRLEKSLFRQNPEFRQKANVEAHVIGRGTLLVRLADEEGEQADQEDPMVAAFLAFIERDATAHPGRIIPLSSSKVADAVELTRNVIVSDDDVIPDDVTF
jgi:antitoxin PrlF